MELNYSQPFSLDSAELIERLLDDLVSTTESYKHVQDREVRLASDLSLAQAQLFPLRKENARLAGQLRLRGASKEQKNALHIQK